MNCAQQVLALALSLFTRGELVARDFVKQLTEEPVCTMRLPSALRGMN